MLHITYIYIYIYIYIYLAITIYFSVMSNKLLTYYVGALFN